ncbi:MAG: MBOAT family O-acyltransferase [Acidimicrobiales bacterium]
MLFPTTDFAIFFAVVFTANWLLNPFPRWWKLFMIAASFVFYSWWDWHYVLLLAASTTIACVGALTIAGFEGRARKMALIGSLAGLLGLLGWFKYYTFLAVNLDNLTHHLFNLNVLPLKEVLLPVGISFYTFMALSYVIDVYRKAFPPARPVDLAVYLSFFPHLVAGPIVRGPELLPQIRHKRDPRHIDFGRAAWLIAAGLFKKMVISAYISSSIVDPVFGSPHTHSNIEILFAIYGYAIQIYADFSGYTDIAIGVALLLGFRFPLNFDGPYTAVSLQDFWRRWHMTLSRWLRDYLYIPLGGNKGSEGRIARNIMITMLLGGLWHGAGWTFVFWGGYHGVGQVVGRWRRSRRTALGLAPDTSKGRRVLERVATFHLVCLGWVFFRATSMSIAFTMIGRLFTAWGAFPLVTPLVVITIVGSIASQYVSQDMVRDLQAGFSRLTPVAQGAILGAILLGITTLAPEGIQPFIYFRF